MNTATFIRLGSDIVEHARTHGYTEYVENVIEPHKGQAADYYQVNHYELVRRAYQIAENLETIGCIVIPEDLD